MARSNTKTINFEKLQRLGAGGHLVVRLMMCCNDMSLANQALAKWKDLENLNADEKARQQGAKMYFIRLQLAHLLEGLKIIEQISRDANLIEFIDRLDEDTRKSFRELEEYLSNGTQRDQVKNYLEKLRSNVIFHYDESSKLTKRSIVDLAANPATRCSSITRGDHAYRWYFRVGDDVLNHLVVKSVWGVEGETQEEVDEVLIWAHNLFLSFMDFSGEFIWRYTSN